ncbi:MAG: type I methionyl aminopeptidase [bacterium]
MIPVKTPGEIESIRKAGRIVGQTLKMLGGNMRAGITTKELDEMAEEFIRSRGAQPAFKGYRGYPASICVSLNEQVVHGIPGGREIREGDLVSVDCGAILDGFYGDSAFSWFVGEPPEETARLMETTKRALEAGIDRMRPGNTVGDISSAVQRVVEEEGFSVVRDLVGHGIGRQMHEEPQVPNYGREGGGPLIKAGMVFAIEPMVNTGKHFVKTLDDGWTVVAADGKPSCHFEHTVAATDDGPDVLTLP